MRDHREQLEALGVCVVLVSFGQEWQVKRWQEETSTPFPLLLDPDRSVYRTFGMERSVAKAWHPKMFLYYLRLLLKGRKLRPIQGDPNQLGGDFLVDNQGIICYAYASEDPADRPTVTELLKVAKSLEHVK